VAPARPPEIRKSEEKEGGWITKEIPFLRIVSDELWNAAKDRQSVTRRTITRAGNIGFARRPQYLFSGLSKCGVCGAGFIMASRNRLACFGAREKGTCDNHLTIRRDEVEARVLKALEEKLLNHELFEEFCHEFTREMNRLRMQHRASLSAAEREIECIEARRKKLIEMVMEGVAPSVVKDELNANAARRKQLEAKLAATEEPPSLLHPEMAGSTERRSRSSRRRSRTRTAGLRPPRRYAASWTPSCSRHTRPVRRFRSS
jgi:site-specific DNA recombinase